MFTFKVVNSTLKPVAGEIHSTYLRVWSLFVNLDFMVAPLDNHTMVLGKDFIKLIKVVPSVASFYWMNARH